MVTLFLGLMVLVLDGLLRAQPYRIVVRPTSYFTHLGHDEAAL